MAGHADHDRTQGFGRAGYGEGPYGAPPPKLYRVGEIADHLGLTRQTIHNYATIGLIAEERRTPGGQKLFDESVFAILGCIHRLKARHRLADIRRMLEDEARAEIAAEDAARARPAFSAAAPATDEDSPPPAGAAASAQPAMADVAPPAQARASGATPQDLMARSALAEPPLGDPATDVPCHRRGSSGDVPGDGAEADVARRGASGGSPDVRPADAAEADKERGTARPPAAGRPKAKNPHRKAFRRARRNRPDTD
jgi:DNA-binding transcriptional MerR regulator